MQGRASCPSTNNVRPIFQVVVAFQNGGSVFSKAVGTFFEGGHEALPSTGYRRSMHALAPFAAWREKISREKRGSRKGAENAKAAQGYAGLSALCGLARK